MAKWFFVQPARKNILQTVSNRLTATVMVTISGKSQVFDWLQISSLYGPCTHCIRAL